MKTFSHLWLDDKGIAAFNAPDKSQYEYGVNTNSYEFHENEYNNALQQALAERVYFNDECQVNVFEYLRVYEGMKSPIKNKPYPVPDGYEVRVVDDYGKWNEESPRWFQYTILVPKEKTKKELAEALCEYCPLKKKGVYSVNGGFVAGCEGSKCDEAFEHYQEDVKQQSLEEAADEWLKKHDGGKCNCKSDFIAGAKSQAAKEYWYEIFKSETGKP